MASSRVFAQIVRPKHIDVDRIRFEFPTVCAADCSRCCLIGTGPFSGGAGPFCVLHCVYKHELAIALTGR